MKRLVAYSIIVLLAACGGDKPVPLAENGEACELSEDCLSETCLTEYGDGVPVPGGICTDECEWNDPASEDVDTCVEGEICLRYFKTSEKHCYLVCQSDRDCREPDVGPDAGAPEWSCECLDGPCNLQACVPAF